jgi:anti-sigma B factor antagonist
MTITREQPAPDTALLRVAGEVDMLTSPDLRQAIAGQLGSGVRRLVIDLDSVEFLGTSGLATLVETRSEAEAHHVELWLVCANRNVLRPLQIAGLVGLFRIADTVSAAMADERSSGKPV